MGELRGKLKRHARSTSHKAVSVELRSQTLSCGQLGANEGFQTGDEMIRTVSREAHCVCSVVAGLGRLEIRGGRWIETLIQ